MKKIILVFSSLLLTLRLHAQEVTTLAGNGVAGSNDGKGTSASFNKPDGVAVDAFGYVYVADYNNNKIRKISPSGEVSSLAGSGIFGSTDGKGTKASFYGPSGVAVDASGYVYVSEYNGNNIRKISPTGEVTTLAGSGTIGNADGKGKNASFNRPDQVAIDAAGYVYVSDGYNNTIRKVSPSGEVTTLAGSGEIGSVDGIGKAASFNNTRGIAVDAAGYVYVSDNGNYKIRKISPSGEVTTLAGSGTRGRKDDFGTSASFASPDDVAVDAAGNVYVADYFNNKIRKISLNGIVTTLAGSGEDSSIDGTGTVVSFYGPTGVAVDASGNVYVSDMQRHKIRKIIQSPTGLIDITYAEGGLSVFPNPNNGVFNICLSKEETFSLMNSLGQTVQAITLSPSNNYTATISGLENGIYFLKGHTANYQNTKIVVGK